MATGNSNLKISGEIISETGSGASANFRAKNGSYSGLFGVSGSSCYIGCTASGSADAGDYAFRFLTGNCTNGFITAETGLYGAYWNDYADIIPCQKGLEIIPGRCYSYDPETKELRLSTKKADPAFIGICTDTFGISTGIKKDSTLTGTERLFPEEFKRLPEREIPMSVAGYALACVDKEYPVGTPLVCTKDGFLTKASWFTRSYRVVAFYWKKEDRKTWFKKKVNERHWIRVR